MTQKLLKTSDGRFWSEGTDGVLRSASRDEIINHMTIMEEALKAAERSLYELSGPGRKDREMRERAHQAGSLIEYVLL